MRLILMGGAAAGEGGSDPHVVPTHAGRRPQLPARGRPPAATGGCQAECCLASLPARPRLYDKGGGGGYQGQSMVLKSAATTPAAVLTKKGIVLEEG